jgi:hypothetical protein
LQGRDARQQRGQLGRDAAGIGEELHLEAQAAGEEVELAEVGAQQGLAAGQAQGQGAEVSRLPEQVLPLGGGQLAGRAAASPAGRLM